MLCEKCRQRQAEIAIREESGGETRELYVCQACAGEGGLIDKKLTSMVEMIFDAALGLVARPVRAQTVVDDPVCPVCGMTRQAFRKRERLGCEACYTAFRRDTEAMIRDMHEGVRHVGKVPAGAVAARTCAELERALKRAIASQRFEEAARLRDALATVSGPVHSARDDGNAEGGAHAAQ
jgi:protein arginine kinase activator